MNDPFTNALAPHVYVFVVILSIELFSMVRLGPENNSVFLAVALQKQIPPPDPTNRPMYSMLATSGGQVFLRIR